MEDEESQDFEQKKRTSSKAPIFRDARKPLSKRELAPLSEQKRVLEMNQYEAVAGRDPRFDPLSGHLKVGLFQKSYQFLAEKKEQEVKILQKQIKKTKNPEDKAKLRQIMATNKDELKRNEMLTKKRELANKIRNQQHINPNKSILKKEMRREKFEDLQRKGKLDDFLSQKRRRLMFKQERAQDFVQ